MIFFHGVLLTLLELVLLQPPFPEIPPVWPEHISPEKLHLERKEIIIRTLVQMAHSTIMLIF